MSRTGARRRGSAKVTWAGGDGWAEMAGMCLSAQGLVMGGVHGELGVAVDLFSRVRSSKKYP
jgi:hypothetical protein